MNRFYILLACLPLCATAAVADTEETVTIDGSVVGKFANRITFDGDNVTLTYDDGTTQTADMAAVSISLTYDSGETGISETVARPEAPARIYTLGGQNAGSSTERLAKGIYIMNGKKIVIR